MLLKLTTISQEPVYVSPSGISGLFQDTGFTEVLLKSGQQLDVQEDAEYIYRQATRMRSFELKQEERKLKREFWVWAAIGVIAVGFLSIAIYSVLFPCVC